MRLLAVLHAGVAGALVASSEPQRFPDVGYAITPGVEAILQSLDIYAPADAKASPVVVYLHGGYWMAGDKRTVGRLPEFFCGAGYLFVSVNYRLAPQARHPTHIQDVAAAVAWVHDHIAEYGGDPAQIFLTGHSAGAHLAALLGTDAKRLGDARKPLSILRAVIPLDSGAMDLNAVAANDRRSDSPYRSALGNDPAAWADASPSAHVASNKALPPFQIVIAYGPAIESKRRGMASFADALRRQGTRAEVVDASSFREHQSLMTEFGASDDPVGQAVLEFIEFVRAGKLTGLGDTRTLQLPGKTAAESAQEMEAYRTRVLMRPFDNNADGKLAADEVPQPGLFKMLDTNGDGVVTREEAVSVRRGGAPAGPGHGMGQAARWKDTGVSASAPLSPAENFKSRPHGDEVVKAGLKPDVLARLDVELQRHVAASNVAGIVALVHKNGVRGYFETFGMADIEGGRPMPKDGIFRLMSMTKPVIAVAALTLYDEGKFSLDEPTSKHCPEWAEPKVLEDGKLVLAKSAITPRMLMSHSSGLYYGSIGSDAGDEGGAAALAFSASRGQRISLKKFSETLARQPLKFHPGAGYQYGHSIDILGVTWRP